MNVSLSPALILLIYTIDTTTNSTIYIAPSWPEVYDWLYFARCFFSVCSTECTACTAATATKCSACKEGYYLDGTTCTGKQLCYYNFLFWEMLSDKYVIHLTTTVLLPNLSVSRYCFLARRSLPLSLPVIFFLTLSPCFSLYLYPCIITFVLFFFVSCMFVVNAWCGSVC